MILGDPELAAPQPQEQSGGTLDELLRRLAAEWPQALGLADAANRATFTDGAPRRLTYAAADRMVTALAGRLRDMGLPTDAVIGIQLPNIVENVLAMLGALRAGMIVAPLPLLWRRAEAADALSRIGAKALITCGRVGAVQHCQLAMRVAADVFSIRYVCGFGSDLPDGMVGLDDLLAARESDSASPARPAWSLDGERRGDAAAHVAAITFDVGEGGLVPVARSHRELLAGGLGVQRESRLAPERVQEKWEPVFRADARQYKGLERDGGSKISHPAPGANILSTVAPSSFAGISLTLLPWLLGGGALVLHHPFDPEVIARQRRDDRCGALVLPGPVALRLADANAFADEPPSIVIAAWRSPERLAASLSWRETNISLVDVSIFGEAGLVAARRSADGRPSPVPLGPVRAPRTSEDGTIVSELIRTEAGTLALRGPMVPRHPFLPSGGDFGRRSLTTGPDGSLDSGYTCRIDSHTRGMVVVGPHPGVANVGGYRFALHALREVVHRIDGRATLSALPEPLIGRRLIGNAADRNKMQAALTALGLSPLVIAAFCDRRERGAASVAAAAAGAGAARTGPLTAR